MVPSAEKTLKSAVFVPTFNAIVFDDPCAGITLKGPSFTLSRKLIPEAVKLICIIVADCAFVNCALKLPLFDTVFDTEKDGVKETSTEPLDIPAELFT